MTIKLHLSFGRSNLTLVSIAALLLGMLSGCSQRLPEESVLESKNAIINGTSVDPATVGHVQVWQKFGSIGFADRGSGTLIHQSIALTGAHVLDPSNCRRFPNVQGNLSSHCFFRPESHAVILGNDDSQISKFDGIRIAVHPRYDPADFESVDVALVGVQESFSPQP